MQGRSLLIVISLLLLLNGCQESSEEQKRHDAQVAQQAKAELLAELEANRTQGAANTQADTRLSPMGITSSAGKITIDLNQSKNYFHQMAEQMRIHAEKFAEDMQKGIIEDKEAGIEMNQTHINIDLNKTKSFLDNWGKKFEIYAKEIEVMIREINTTTTNTPNKGN